MKKKVNHIGMVALFAVLIVGLMGCVTTPETGRSAFIITSAAEEAAMGLQAFRQILKTERLSTNKRWNKILQRVGWRVAKAANQPNFRWQFVLIESDQVNAFCLPGGKVAFYTGILSVAQTEGGIAVVMGHEVAHATARHSGQRITQAMGLQLGLVGVSLALGQKNTRQNQMIMAALGLGTQVGVVLPFSRSNESEADEIGLIYSSRAGYDPREAPRFWQRMAAKGGSRPPEFLSTHPASASRTRALNGQLSRVIPIYNQSSKHGLGERL